MQEVEKFQLLASTSLASKVADFLYLTRVSSDAISREVVFLAFREARVNRIIRTALCGSCDNPYTVLFMMVFEQSGDKTHLLLSNKEQCKLFSLFHPPVTKLRISTR